MGGFFVVVAVLCVVFIASRLLGDPVSVMLPVEATEQERSALRSQLGLDQPVTSQAADYFGDLIRLDFGESLWQRRPAIDIVLEALPSTLVLVSLAMALAFIVGPVVGLISVLKPAGKVDRLLQLLDLAAVSMPHFWLGLMLIWVFAVQLGVLPTSGSGTPKHLILPVVTLAVEAIGRLALVTRASMLEQLQAEYIRLAWSRGLSAWLVLGRHLLRNSIVPVLAVGGYATARAIAGHSVVVETVLAWPGIGHLTKLTLERRDVVLLQAIVLIVSSIVVAINIGFDIVTRFVDPRIRANVD